MRDRRDFRDLVGRDTPPDELEQLARVDTALRATPPPPHVSDSLTERVLAIPGGRSSGQRRVFAGLALAAALAAATFGVGMWVGGDDGGGGPVAQIALEPTANAPESAWMLIDVLPEDPAGNWAMTADVSGLAPLAEGGYYEVWLTRDGKLSASCGRFVVASDGTAEDVWLNAPYAFEGYERWVVVSKLPDQKPSSWLLDGPVMRSA
jgi:hypothetical protein